MPTAVCISARMYFSGMGITQSMHEYAQISVVLRMEYHMPVIWHELIRKDAHICNFFCLQQKLLEELIILVPVKNFETTICTIDYVINFSTNVNSGNAGHE